MTGCHGQRPGPAGRASPSRRALCRDRAIASGSLALLARPPHLLPPTRRKRPRRCRPARAGALDLVVPVQAAAVGCSAQLGSTESLAASGFSSPLAAPAVMASIPVDSADRAHPGGGHPRATRLVRGDPRSSVFPREKASGCETATGASRVGSVLCPSLWIAALLGNHPAALPPRRARAAARRRQGQQPARGLLLLARSAYGAGLRLHLERAGSALPPARPKRLRRRAAPASPCCSVSASRFPPCTPAASTAKALP